MGITSSVRVGSARLRRVTTLLATSSLMLLGSPVVLSPAAEAAALADDGSTKRVGVLALAGAISAVGQTEDLGAPLPLTDTSLAEVLQLDEKLTEGLTTALANTDLEQALEDLEGVDLVADGDPDLISFTYTRSATTELDLAYDDGDLRLGEGAAAGRLRVSLTTRPGSPFVVAVDDQQEDPLLRVALVGQPVMDLAVDVQNDALEPFTARQGFTEVDVTGGSYEIHRDQVIRMRDPDGRGVLTLEDLRYSTLPDLFDIDTTRDVVVAELAIALPDSLGGGTGDEREGTLVLDQDDTVEGAAWPLAADADTTYGTALERATDLTRVDGLTALAQYTGTVLALQDAAEVPFPQLGGGTSDLFAPGDDLLELLATAASAQIRCGAAPESPPAGLAAPGDTVYCNAVTPDGLGSISDVTWSTAGGDGTVAAADTGKVAAIGPAPGEVVRVDGSDGEPDVTVTFSAGTGEDKQTFTARVVPNTVQDVVRRIDQLDESSASAALVDGRLDVDVAIRQATASRDLELGNPGTLGTLVGLTGLTSPRTVPPTPPARGTATATGAVFDVGFGIQTGPVGDGTSRVTSLVPADTSVLEIADLSATAPGSVTGLPARIGFLGVTADLTGLSLGRTAGSSHAVSLDLEDGSTAARPISDLLTEEGALKPSALTLDNDVTAGISFTATETVMPGGGYATGGSGPLSGGATVSWGPAALPTVGFSGSYDALRVFDPVPAVFLSGTATVTEGTPDSVSVAVTLPAGVADLYELLNVEEAPGSEPTEVARRMLAGGPSCQNVTILDDTTLTCDGLAPEGEAAVDAGAIELVVLGDPFAMRDAVIEGFAGALSSFDRITADNRTGDGADDQFTSTLPLVDLTPTQLAVEREGLRAGLAAVDAAAAEDEISADHGSRPPVSSAQDLDENIDALMPEDAAGAELDFVTGSQTSLGVSLAAGTPEGRELEAPLRFAVNGPGQLSSIDSADGTSKAFDVGVDSDTTLAIDVVKATARPAVAAGTGTVSTATLDLTGAELRNESFLAGVSSLLTSGDANEAHLGVEVSTTFDVTDGVFRTSRAKTRTEEHAAEAHLVYPAATAGDPDLEIDYTASATDSSGGTGAVQPAPSAMQVQFLAEGLDGLAAAVDSAMDGSAPRNVGPGGAPVSAPLIGTDLDAGADVAGVLTGLTSDLRDQLAAVPVGDTTTAAELTTALETATADALATAEGLAGSPTVAVTVTCDKADLGCEEADGPTEWETVTVATTVTGAVKTGEATFETGLAGLEVHSDETVATTTEWSLPVTLRLQRGSGPQVVVGDGDTLSLDVDAVLPEGGIDAIVGYLPARLTAADAADRSVTTTVDLALDGTEGTDATAYDLFDLYDGALAASPSFSTPAGRAERGLELAFQTLATDDGVLDLAGTIAIPWNPENAAWDDQRGFGEVTYDNVGLGINKVVKGIATPFAVIDPYLAPVRDIVEVLRTPLPVISDLSELAGGDEVSLLSLLETVAAARGDKRLELAHRVIGLIDGVAKVTKAASTFSSDRVLLDDVTEAGAVLLSIDPSEVEVHDSCKQSMTTTTTTTNPDGTTTSVPRSTKPAPCPDENVFEQGQQKKGVAGQTTNENRTGTRRVSQDISQKTRNITANIPGFSMPFLTDPDQIMDVLTGEGEAAYFRIDFGTLAAQVAYTQRFGPIMAGPVPIMPFVGGSISVEGRLAMGFDSYPQTLAVEQLSSPGATAELLNYYAAEFDGDGDVIEEGFYIDDLDNDGVDVPEVKLVTTLEAGAGVSIGIVTAGLKGGVTLTLNLDLNDPDDSGRLRAAEIRDLFAGDASCIFDASGEIEAFISVFVEIQLLLTSLEYEFDILRLGPYTLFEYGCPDEVPVLVVPEEDADGNVVTLALTSGSRSSQRIATGSDSVADEFEVRQFDSGNVSRYEVSGFGRVQRVDVTRSGGSYSVTVYDSAISVSATNSTTYPAGDAPPTFVADGGEKDDVISFLPGETFAADGALRTTAFSTPVTSLTGGTGSDTLITGDGNDRGIDGGTGDDVIDAGLGDDVATGGSENDIVGGGSGRDDLTGGTGNDRLEGGPGADRAVGGEGDDNLVGGPGRDPRAVLVLPDGENGTVVEDQVRLGFDSGDVLVGGQGADTVDGADGSDVVVGGDAPSLTDAGLGSLFEDRDVTVNLLDADDDGEVTTRDVPRDTAVVPDDDRLDDLCESGTLQTGTGTADFVTGGPEADYVVGGDGADRLDGGAGPDELCGRAGDDQVSGDGAITEDEGDNADVVRGGHGHDRVDGGPGDDLLLGDDARLVRGEGNAATRILDGSLGGPSTSDGEGDDYLDGGDGADVLAGGLGSDLLLGSLGDDAAYGEGRDTTDSSGGATEVADRLVACNTTTRVVLGKVDLNGDLLAGPGTDDGIAADTGQLAGLRVVDGVVRELGTTTGFSGLLGSDVVISLGLVDLDRDGLVGSADTDGGDTGMVALPSMLEAGSAEGDCVLAGEGNDELLGGLGSDYLGAGEGTDLASGGWGFDLLLGDGGTDVLLGGSHGDVLVGGTEADHLLGGDGEDRLRGNEGADDLVGGSDVAGADDGQDVLLGGRQEDVLAAENAVLVSAGVLDAVGDPAVPWDAAAYVPDAVRADDASAWQFEGSAAGCDGPSGTRWLTILENDGTAGEAEASPGTEKAYDELYGGYDCDVVVGSTGDDLVRGGQGDDLVEAGPGADIAYGDDGDDVVVGGSSLDHEAGEPVAFTTDRDGAGVADGGDRVRGDGGPDGAEGDGHDLLAGDNALPIWEDGLAEDDGYDGPAYRLQLHDVGTTDATAPAGTGGADTMTGDGGTDRVLGQGGADSIAGDLGDDYLEGNDGGDTMTGGEGADDVVGGSSAADGLPLGGSGERLFAVLAGPFDATAAGLLDEGVDRIDSGAGADVVLGDNGRITRPEPTSPTRHIARADEDDTAEVSDRDEITTGADADRVLAQGGNDLVDAGSENDHVEGNEGADGLTGGAGADTVIGGSSLSPDNRGTLDSLASHARTQLDGNDVIDGDLASPGAVASDLLLGDNATVLVLESGRAVVQLADLSTTTSEPAGLTSGDDTVRGGLPVDGRAGAPDRVFGQGGSDTVTTGPAGDYLEGNSGDDTLDSGDGADDVVGGSSAADGRPLGETGERLGQRVVPRLDTSARGLLDGTDTVRSGAGDDTVLGDNGRITRPTDGRRPVPDVAMADTGEPATYGSDQLYGEDGHDVLYGQLDDGTGLGTGDRLEGGTGNDTVLGDLATVTRTPAPVLSGPRTLTVKGTTIAESVYAASTVVPETWVPQGQATNGGPDLALGGSGNDSLFLGGGADLANGEVGLDTLFGGDGDDVLWGGTQHDRILGGYGSDQLDLKERSGDPAVHATVRSEVDMDEDPVTHNGDDFIHGGWGPDELQADVGGSGRSPGTDHLVDWTGAYNVYYVCGGAYGQGKVIRESSPSAIEMLTALAEASGSRELTSPGSGGWYDLGMVYNGDKSANTGKHPDYPGNFACG